MFSATHDQGVVHNSRMRIDCNSLLGTLQCLLVIATLHYDFCTVFAHEINRGLTDAMGQVHGALDPKCPGGPRSGNPGITT